MAKHLFACPKYKERVEFVSEQRNTNFFLIRAQQDPYWLYIQIPAFYTLYDLDALLRREWLECCGHLSCFVIKETTYDYCYDGDEPLQDMEVKLRDILAPGLTFSHDYDYGTTTRLQLEVIEAYKSPFSAQPTVIARNNPPKFVCQICNQPAEIICHFCQEKTCSKCIKDHLCKSGEDPENYASPLLNSPRTGVCGYDGTAQDIT